MIWTGLRFIKNDWLIIFGNEIEIGFNDYNMSFIGKVNSIGYYFLLFEVFIDKTVY